MKKLTRMVCLAVALILSGFATASAWPWFENCYYDCGHVETVFYGACCGTFHAADGGYAVHSDTTFCP